MTRSSLNIRYSALTLLCGALVAGTAPASAQQYPVRPIRLISPNPAGGANDVIGRIVAHKIGEILGQQMVVDNRGGAGGNIGSRIVAGAAPDGYTLLVNTAAISINASLYMNPGFDIYSDFVPVALTGSTPGLFAVHASNSAGTLRDLIRSAKGRNVTYATAGVGSSSHLAGDYLLRSLAGLNATHVPFQGGGPATAAALANQVDVLSLSMPPVVPHIKAGRLKGLAISSLTRVAALPDVPTVTEAGFPGFEERSWVGYFAPAKTPAVIVKKLNAEINPILGLPDVKSRLDSMGLETKPGSPEAFAAYLKSEVAKWAKIIKTIGITAH